MYNNVRARSRFATINRKNISLVRAQNFPREGTKFPSRGSKNGAMNALCPSVLLCKDLFTQQRIELHTPALAYHQIIGTKGADL